MISIERLLERASELVPMRPTAARLAQVLSSPQFGIDEVVNLINYDQAITANVLRASNAAALAGVRRIETVRDAVVRLGAGRILRMAMSQTLHSSFSHSMAEYGFSEDDLWRHSIAAASAAESLSRCCTVTIPPVAFTAALLHDIGKLLLARSLAPEHFASIRQYITEKSSDWCDAERAVTGITHADVGSALAASWGLPESIVSAIANHHSLDTDFSPVTDAVRIANAAARSIGEGMGVEWMGFTMDQGIASRLGITREGFERLCAETVVHLADIRAEFDQ